MIARWAFAALALCAACVGGCGQAASTLQRSPAPVTFAQLQNFLNRQNTCSGTPCATGRLATGTPQPQQTYLVRNHVSSPSRSGSSTALTIYPQPNTAGDVLYYTPALGEYPRATQFAWDFWYMIDQDVWNPTGGPGGNGAPIAEQSLEFDFNDNLAGDPGYDYNFSSQCLLQAFDAAHGTNGPRWQIWGQKTDRLTGGTIMGWIDSGMACTPHAAFTKQTWHHLTWRYRVDPAARQTHYVSLTIDGVTTTPNPSPNPITKLDRAQARSDVQVQFQQDVRGLALPPPSFTEWVDDVTLTLW